MVTLKLHLFINAAVAGIKRDWQMAVVAAVMLVILVCQIGMAPL